MQGKFIQQICESASFFVKRPVTYFSLSKNLSMSGSGVAAMAKLLLPVSISTFIWEREMVHICTSTLYMYLQNIVFLYCISDYSKPSTNYWYFCETATNLKRLDFWIYTELINKFYSHFLKNILCSSNSPFVAESQCPSQHSNPDLVSLSGYFSDFEIDHFFYISPLLHHD